jgi:hypothetical protein
MARFLEVFLDKTFTPAKSREGLTGGRVKLFRNLFEGVGDLEPSTAATMGCFDGDRNTVFLGESDDLVG